MLSRLFSRLFGRNTATRTIDPALGHPYAAQSLALLTARDWNTLEALCAPLRVDERHVLVSAMGAAATDGALAEWIRHDATGLAHLVKGVYHIDRGWKARGRGAATTVSQQGGLDFFAHLEQAKQALEQSITLNPGDPEALARLLVVAKGTGELDDAQVAFRRYETVGIAHLGASLEMTDILTPKWKGSNELMFQFARAQANAHPGHAACIAHAHIESWVYARMQDSRSKAARKYFTSSDVKKELRECWERDTSLSGEAVYFGAMARNLYAFCFSMLGDNARTKKALRELGDQCTLKPWLYLNENSFTGLNIARKEVGLRAL